MEVNLKRCPYCAEEINADAIKCKHCGEILDPAMRAARQTAVPPVAARERKWQPGVAAILSFLIPGVGQMYKGNVIAGLVWLVAVSAGYFLLFIPGVILHIICIITAAQGDPYRD